MGGPGVNAQAVWRRSYGELDLRPAPPTPMVRRLGGLPPNPGRHAPLRLSGDLTGTQTIPLPVGSTKWL